MTWRWLRQLAANGANGANSAKIVNSAEGAHGVNLDGSWRTDLLLFVYAIRDTARLATTAARYEENMR